MTLGDYIKAASERRFVWGEHDCCTFPIGWLGIATGRDAMAAFRRQYGDEEAARDIILRGCGLDNLWRAALRGIASEVTGAGAALAGDVAVITVPNEDVQPEPMGALFTGKRWCFLSARGIVAMPIELPMIRGIWRG